MAVLFVVLGSGSAHDEREEMKKKISAAALATLLVAGSAYGSGFRIPEQSVDSTAKAGANIASASRADAAYYNPANMSWLEDTTMIQGNASYIYLSPINYDSPTDGASESEDENFLVPTGFMVSPFYGDFRFGFSMTSPNGLSKRWKSEPGSSVAQEFSLLTVELNPTVSYRINEKISVAGGVRMLYADATLNNALYRLDGYTIEWGYNFALSVKPTENINISATYRSNIDLNFSDDATTFKGGGVFPVGVGYTSTSIPSPAVFALSTAFEPIDKLTVELTWDRTFWSEYEELDLANSYYPDVPGVQTFPKEWDDSNCYRIGLSYQYSDVLELMGGFAYDETPIPDVNVNFELPDSDAWLYSLGFQYQYSDNLEFGMAVLYDYKESRDIGDSGDGEFTNASAVLVTTGLSYKF